MTHEDGRAPERLQIRREQIKVLSSDSQNEVAIDVDRYTNLFKKRDPTRACIVVGGIASQIGEHPLPVIAGVAADTFGQSFVIAEPSHSADSDWQNVQGHRNALRQTIRQLSKSNAVEKLSVIGYSLGGAKAITALGLEDDAISDLEIESILCLSAPQTENLLDLTYFRDRTVETDDALVLGRRQRRVQKNYLSGGEREEVDTAILNLQARGIPITSVIIDGDQVVPDALTGEGIETRVCILETDGLRPPDVHLWKGAENTRILEGEIKTFLENGNNTQPPNERQIFDIFP